MKVEVNEKEPSKKIKYPCLMINKEFNLIVLFSSEQNGTVISKANIYKLGEYLDGCVMESFTPFNGTITLQND